MGRSKIIGALPRTPLEVLRYVVLIAEGGSTVAAAHAVNMTPSSLSRKIAQLEHELGLTLFERHSRGMRPTGAGELLVEAARQVLARMEQLASDIDDVDGMGRGSVRIYVSQALVEHFLMPSVLRMTAQYPNIKIDLHVGVGRQAERGLLEDHADFALIITVPRHPDIEIVAERSNRVVALVKPSHPLAARRRVEVSDLVAMPFAALPSTYSSRVAFNSLLPETLKGVQPQLTANSITALKAFALSGSGAAIVPELSMRGDELAGRLVVLELIGAEATDTRMCLCRRQSRTLGGAARRLIADIAASFADHEIDGTDVAQALQPAQR